MLLEILFEPLRQVRTSFHRACRAPKNILMRTVPRWYHSRDMPAPAIDREGLGHPPIGNSIDGRTFLNGSPMRSIYFRIVTVLGLCIVTIDGYILVRYWRIVPAALVSLLGVLIGVQTVYQWWRALYYYRLIRQIYNAEIAKGGNPESNGAALSIAAKALTDMLFYSFAMILLLLIVVELFLVHHHVAK